MRFARLALPLLLAAALALTATSAASAAGQPPTTPAPAARAEEEPAPAAVTDVAAACTDLDAHAALASLCEAYGRDGLPAWAKESLAKVILRLANGEHGHRHQLLRACRALLDSDPVAEGDKAERCRTLLGEVKEQPEQLCKRVLAGDVANAPESLVKRCKALLDDDPARCRRLADQPEANATATEELRARCRHLIGEKADEFCKRMMTLPQNATNVSPELKERCRAALANAEQQSLQRVCAAFAANPERLADKAAALRERCAQKPERPAATLEAQCKELAANPQLAAQKPDLKERCARLQQPKPATPRPELTLDACRRLVAAADGSNPELLAKCRLLLEREGTPRPKPSATATAKP
jgi:hypothetical protein